MKTKTEQTSPMHPEEIDDLLKATMREELGLPGDASDEEVKQSVLNMDDQQVKKYVARVAERISINRYDLFRYALYRLLK